jgi:hypothetical protein
VTGGQGVAYFNDPNSPVVDGCQQYCGTTFNAMASNGLIAGSYYDENGNVHMFILRTDGTYAEISSPAVPTGLNSSGFYVAPNGSSTVIGRGTSPQTRDFGCPGATMTAVTAINDQSLAVGNYVDSKGVSHPFWTKLDNACTALPNLPASAVLTGVNNLGLVVGFFSDAYGTHGLVATLDGRYESVDAPMTFDGGGNPEPVDTQITGINDQGVAVGNAGPYYDTEFGPNTHLFVASPVAPPVTLTLNPSSFTFNPSYVGQASVPEQFVLQNTGWETARVYPSVQGPFVYTSSCTSYLGPGQSCRLVIHSKPQTVGATSGQVVVQSNESGTPTSLTASLYGQGVGTSLRLSTQEWNFGPVPVGTTSGPGYLWIHNNGSDPVYFNGISITGSGDFSITKNTCPVANFQALQPFTTCEVDFNVTPSQQGPDSATLLIHDSANSTVQQVGLQGYGNPAPGK